MQTPYVIPDRHRPRGRVAFAVPGLLHAVLVAALLTALLTTGCRRDAPPPQAAGGADEARDEAAASGDSPGQEREAFGLPLPPEYHSIRRLGALVTVNTSMSIDDLEAFFKTRLVDYEVLRLNARQMRIIGLRAYMPSIDVYRVGGRYGHVEVNYKPASEPRAEHQPRDPDEPHVDTGRSREKGMPVMLRTSDGELLAPGARWHEPYIPPPGTPLHRERYRSNWGKPFGQWTSP